MIRLNLVLLLAVMLSAMYLVHTQYSSRRLVTEMHRAEAEARKLEVERESLEVERRSQATPARVQRLAREKLQMRSPNPATTQYVTYAGAVLPVHESVTKPPGASFAKAAQGSRPASGSGVAR
ncbi:MAG TPA: cell division protein FtsL [Burkholderiaceae bacterium]|nr:cell division protein FtsL [Burkholderiaceae bacterium]